MLGRAMISLTSLLLIGACGKFSILDTPIVLKCPEYFIIEEAAGRIQFRDGPGRDIVDIEDKAQIGNIDLGCISNVKTNTNAGSMDLEIAPIFGVERGAADRDQKATLPYFISITDQNRNILYREAFKFNVSFAGNKTRLIAKAPLVKIEIPITSERRSSFYRIYVGMELTKDQLAHNRKLIEDALR